jgi:diguanylate cyclase (GGDEF)-like protein
MSTPLPNLADQALSIRVILAGRTGLDQALRRDAGIELIRASSALEALGELSEPIDDESPEQAVVIVDHELARAMNAREFAAAVRTIKPTARCLLALPGTGVAAVGIEEHFHGAVRATASAADVRRAAGLPAGAALPTAREVQSSALSGAPSKQAASTVFPALPPLPALPALPSLGASTVAARAGSVEPKASVSQTVMFSGLTGPGLPAMPAMPSLPALPPIPSAPTAPVARATPSNGGAGEMYVVEAPRPVGPVGAAPAPRVVAKAGVQPPPLPAFAPSGKMTSTPASALTAPESAWSWNEDRAVLSALASEHDVLSAALASIRKRTGRADIGFAPEGAQRSPAGSFRVAHGVKTFGHLTSPSLPGMALEPAAHWLAQVLHLRDELASLRTGALTDELTGAFNRRYLASFLDGAVATSAVKRHQLSVLVFDIDHFKSYNDRHGHGAGDELLKQTVALLRSMVRPDDRVCRVGGDEFVVVFYEPSGPRDPASRHPESAEAISSRFQRAIGEHKFLRVPEGTRLTISAGLATFPWEGHTARELLDRADAKLLEAKRAGRNALRIEG